MFYKNVHFFYSTPNYPNIHEIQSLFCNKLALNNKTTEIRNKTRISIPNSFSYSPYTFIFVIRFLLCMYNTIFNESQSPPSHPLLTPLLPKVEYDRKEKI